MNLDANASSVASDSSSETSSTPGKKKEKKEYFHNKFAWDRLKDSGVTGRVSTSRQHKTHAKQ